MQKDKLHKLLYDYMVNTMEMKHYTKRDQVSKLLYHLDKGYPLGNPVLYKDMIENVA